MQMYLSDGVKGVAEALALRLHAGVHHPEFNSKVTDRERDRVRVREMDTNTMRHRATE